MSTFIICFLLAFWPVIRLFSFGLGPGIPDISFDRVVLILFLFWIVIRKSALKKNIKVDSAMLWLFLYCIFVGINSFIVHVPNKLEILQLLFDTYIISFLAYFVLTNAFDTVSKKTIHYSILFSGVIISCIGISEFIAGHNLVGPSPLDYSYEKAYFRPNGPFYDVIGYGAILLLYLPFTFFLMKKFSLNKIVGFLLVTLFCFASFLSFSRADIIAMVLISFILVMSFRFRDILIAFYLVIIACVLIYIMQDIIGSSAIYQERVDPQTIVARYHSYTESIKLFLSNPLIGIGYNNYIKTHIYATHNSYLQVLIELGVIGFVIFIGYLFSLIKSILIESRKKKDRTFLKITISLLVIMIFIPNTVNLLHNAQFMFAFLIILANLNQSAARDSR